MNQTTFRMALVALVMAGTAIMSNQSLADPEQNSAFPAYSIGPGIMHGHGIGPCMMGGYSALTSTNLNADQQRKINAIQDDLRHKHGP